MKRARIIVSGRVQGVFFRANIREFASNLKLKGFVRNMDDDVEIVVEGEQDKIDKLVGYCKSNPGSSKVEKVQVVYEEIKGEFSDFSIRY